MQPPGFCSYEYTNDIEWDSNGKMYVGTNSGLNVFDGNSWVLYDYPNTFNNFCSVEGIAFDSSKTLWLGTSYGICFRDTLGNWDSLTIFNSALPLPLITHISIDANNIKWMLGREWQGGYPALIKLDGTNFTAYDTSNTPEFSNGIYDMEMDSHGNIWLASDTMILKFDGTAWTTYTDSDWNIPNSEFGSFEFDKQGILWFTVSTFMADHYLIRFDGTSFIQMPVLTDGGTDKLISLTIDEEGNKWMLEEFLAMYMHKFDGSSWSKDTISTPQFIMMIKCHGHEIWMGSQMADPNSDIYCFNEYGFNRIEGVGYLDLNGDQTRQANESSLPSILFHLMPQNVFTISDTSGYSFLLSDTIGSYTVSAVVPPNWFSMTPSINVIQTHQHEISDSIDFDLRHEGSADDVSISITAGAMRPGFNSTSMLSYRNKSSNVLSDTITFISDSGMTFNGSFPSPIYQSNDSIQWSYSNLVPFEMRSIIMNYTTAPNVQIGTEMKMQAFIQPSNTDTFPSDNKDTSTVIVTGSFDPNAKEVRPEGNILPTQPLEYTISFQNTGSDTAFTAIVRDTLNPLLDISTLEILGVSHPYTLQLHGRTLEFRFENIMLPDSNVNEMQSHGFIKYRIRPAAGIPNGSIITNTAGIIFDFNLAVLTNTTLNTVDFFLTAETASSSGQLKIFPNPINDLFNISFPNRTNQSYVLTIYDATGKIILTESSPLCNHGNCTWEIDLKKNKIMPGIFTAVVQNDNEIFTGRFICIN